MVYHKPGRKSQNRLGDLKMERSNWQVLKEIRKAIDAIIEIQSATDGIRLYFASDRYRDTLQKLREDERIVEETI